MTRFPHVLAAVAAIAVAAPTAASAAVLTSGVLTGADGAPAAGQVRVFAWVYPQRGQTLEMPLLGSAAAGPDGRFTVSALDDARLRALAARRGGWLDFKVVGETAGHTGRWGFTGYVDAPAGQARVSSADAALDAGGANAASGLRHPFVRLRAARPKSARASQVGGPCAGVSPSVRALRSARKLTIVGELNNAYNDGTVGRFSYSRQKSAETFIGAAIEVPLKHGKVGWEINEEYLIHDGGRVTFPPAKKRYSRKLRSLFEYTLYEHKSSPCAKPEREIRATSWIGDQDSSLKQDGLDKCDPRHFVGSEGTATWSRDSGNAVRFTRAVTAFGVNLTARSGFSDNVTLEYVWGGPPSKKHYLCGPDGKQSPFESGRVFSGARK